MIFAIDFDGTLCEDKFPHIGNKIESTVNIVKQLKRQDNKIILWTCRTGKYLEDAVQWCRNRGIEFDAINENLKEIQMKWGSDTRKIYCDYYLDDKNINLKELIKILK